MVISWLLRDQLDPRTVRYRSLIGDRPALLAFQTIMELRYGALRAQWGELRRMRLERRIAALRLHLPLVSHDDVFDRAPRLETADRPTGCRGTGRAASTNHRDATEVKGDARASGPDRPGKAAAC